MAKVTNLRVDPETVRMAKIGATLAGKTMAQWVKEAIAEKFEKQAKAMEQEMPKKGGLMHLLTKGG